MQCHPKPYHRVMASAHVGLLFEIHVVLLLLPVGVEVANRSLGPMSS